MWDRLKPFLVWLGPALALGLYSGRVLSEQWAKSHNLTLSGAIGLTLAVTLLSAFMLRLHPLRQTWPLLVLWGYVVFPHPRLSVALAVGLVTAILFGQMASRSWTFLHQPRFKIGLAFAVGVGGLILYGSTIAPGLLPADSGEFQVIAANLGIAHPPGFPLYTLLAYLMTRLPLPETAAFKVNLFSALTSSATLVLVYLISYRLTRRHLAGLTAVLALGTATTFWSQATTANIRSLTALLAALAFYLLVAWRQARTNQPLASSDRYLIGLFLVVSLGITHHLSLAFMALVMGLTIWLEDPTFVRQPRRWGRPLLAALVGLLPLLYLPLRAGANVRGASPDLATLSGFFEHFLGLGFQGDFFYFIQPVVLWQRFQVMGNVLTFQFSPWLLLGMGLGLLLLLVRDWKLALLLGGSFGLHTFITATYRAPQTVEYMLPAYVNLALILGYGLGTLPRLFEFQPGKSAARLLLAGLFVAALSQSWQHWPSFVTLHQVEDARDYAQPLLAQAPPNSVILANWHWATPLWYLQEVEKQRPDVTVQYVPPGGESYGQTWVQEINARWQNGRPVIATYFDPYAYAELLPPEPIAEAFLFSPTPHTRLPDGFTPLDLTLNETVRLLGWQQPDSAAVGTETTLTLAWEPLSDSAAALPLYAHLVGEDGRLYAQSDLQVRPQPGGISLTRFRLTPRPGTAPGEYALFLGSGADRQQVGVLTVTASQTAPVTQHPVSRQVVGERPSRTLLGYDWDSTLPEQFRLYLHWRTTEGYQTEVRDVSATENIPLPSLQGPWGLPGRWTIPTPQPENHYVPLGHGIVWTGQSLTGLASPLALGTKHDFSQRFVSGRPVWRDLVVSVRLVGLADDGFTWTWCDLVDSVPAMGGIPTLKWIGGSAVSARRTVIYPEEPVPFPAYCTSQKPAPRAPILHVAPEATPGQTISASLTLYDAFTNETVPILDERITARYAWLPLGNSTLAVEG